MPSRKKILFLTLLFATFFILSAAPAKAQIGTASSSKFIPQCLLGSTVNTQCDNVNIFIWLGINIGFYLFSFVGALALLIFVYGGFRLIFSRGIPEEVSKGKNAIVAAIIGLVIAFSAYALVTFLSNTIGVKSQYQLNFEMTNKA